MNNDPDYYSDPDRKFRRLRMSSTFFYLNIVLLAVNFLLLAFFIGNLVQQKSQTLSETETPGIAETYTVTREPTDFLLPASEIGPDLGRTLRGKSEFRA